jgi:ubiquinone/menaquinone biosynthesis C-methylase UbiE
MSDIEPSTRRGGYIMDTKDEGGRIERKTDRALTLEQLRWAGVGRGMSVLDLGCAAGTTCRLLADLVGTEGRVVGVDRSVARLDEAARHPDHHQEIQYRVGDATSLPCSDGEFDVSWSRFLFEYLPCPAAALIELRRVTKVGGVVCVSDIDGNCIWNHPCCPWLRSEVAAALDTLADGFDPHAGAKLFSMFVDAGFHDVATDVRVYHSIVGAIDPERETHWRMKLDGVVLALVARGWPEARASGLREAFLAHLRDPRTLTYSVIVTVRGRVG